MLRTRLVSNLCRPITLTPLPSPLFSLVSTSSCVSSASASASPLSSLSRISSPSSSSLLLCSSPPSRDFSVSSRSLTGRRRPTAAVPSPSVVPSSSSSSSSSSLIPVVSLSISRLSPPVRWSSSTPSPSSSSSAPCRIKGCSCGNVDVSGLTPREQLAAQRLNAARPVVRHFSTRVPWEPMRPPPRGRTLSTAASGGAGGNGNGSSSSSSSSGIYNTTGQSAVPAASAPSEHGPAHKPIAASALAGSAGASGHTTASGNGNGNGNGTSSTHAAPAHDHHHHHPVVEEAAYEAVDGASSSPLAHLFEANRDWAARIVDKDPQFFSSLARQQQPEYLWIGCSDSRVPANQIIGLPPGEVFVHRNIANVVVHSDLNALSVIQYAVDLLRVKHIMVVGHYGCGGVNAAMRHQRVGLADNWLRHVQDVKQRHENGALSLSSLQLSTPATNGHGAPSMSREREITAARLARLCELNVIEQTANVCSTTIVQDAWSRGQSLTVHGWIYGLQDGLIRDLHAGIAAESPATATMAYTTALAALHNTIAA